MMTAITIAILVAVAAMFGSVFDVPPLSRCLCQRCAVKRAGRV